MPDRLCRAQYWAKPIRLKIPFEHAFDRRWVSSSVVSSSVEERCIFKQPARTDGGVRYTCAPVLPFRCLSQL